MTTTFRRSISTGLGLLAAAVLLASCASASNAGEAAPTPTASTSAPTPAPTPLVDRIVISGEAITVVADDGTTLASYDYFQPTAEVVVGLAAYLGDPVDTRVEGGGDESTPATLHDWEGLQLYDTDQVEEAPYWPNHQVRLNGPMSGDVALATAGGIAVGDAFADIDMTGAGQPVEYVVEESGLTYRSFPIEIVALPPGPGTGDAPTLSLQVDGPVDVGAVETIQGPLPSYGH